MGGGVNVGPGIFFWREGGVLSPRDFLRFSFLPSFDHPCHLKSGVIPPPMGCSTLFFQFSRM